MIFNYQIILGKNISSEKNDEFGSSTLGSFLENRNYTSHKYTLSVEFAPKIWTAVVHGTPEKLRSRWLGELKRERRFPETSLSLLLKDAYRTRLREGKRIGLIQNLSSATQLE